MFFVLDISIEHRSDTLRKDFSAAFIALFTFLTIHLSEQSLKRIQWLTLKIAVLRMKVTTDEHVRKVSFLINLEAY